MVSAFARKCLTRGRGSALIRVLRLRASACLVVAPGRGGSAAVRLAFDESDDDQKNDGTDHGVDDGADETGERHEPQLREQPDADEGAHDADDDVPEESEAKTAHDLPCQPAGNRADDQHDDNAVYSNHDVLPDTAGHERPAATFAMQRRMQLRKRSPSLFYLLQPPPPRSTLSPNATPIASPMDRFCEA